MFNKILIANRGEIACRIIATCRRLGVRTVAVYSDADRDARHVRLADEAIHIGAAAAAESYLNAAAIIAAAKQSGAEAIHPGFGFLSERSAFVKAVEKAGLVFIGPSGAVMDKMGAKDTAKTIMEKAGVPVVPGYHGSEQDAKFLAGQADKIGYPLMVKASAGGGGKGMRIVREAKEFSDALASAKREAKSAFGDDNVLLEKFVEGPRHIEFQVFGDTQGNIVHLFERECSVQRRYQKIIEETPSPFLDDAMRAAMGEAAVAAARAVNYVNAGTVEFIVGSDRQFYFMEMNTRLQVEHPVTEMTTGLDLVELQLRVAAGEPLPFEQNELEQHGHAIEVRLYAEKPRQDFLPSVGVLQAFVAPEESDTFRLDTGVETGDEITIHYDPMIAKMIVWHEDRPAALRELQQVLNRTAVFGLTTNLSLLRRIAAEETFLRGDVDTRYIDTHLDELNRTPAAPRDVITAAAIDILLDSDDDAAWDHADGFQLNALSGRRFVFHDENDGEQQLFLRHEASRWVVQASGETYHVAADLLDDDTLLLDDGNGKRYYRILRLGDELVITRDDHCFMLKRMHPFAPKNIAGANEQHPGAPMPGRIVAIHVKPGDAVDIGQPLLVLEGMKMEYTLKAGVAGRIDRILYQQGDMVDAEVPLVDITADQGD